MAPSFHPATRQLGDRFINYEHSIATAQTRRGFLDGNASPLGFVGNDNKVVDYSFGEDRHTGRQERELPMHYESPDRYSYRRATPISSANYPCITYPRVSDHFNRYQNDSILSTEDHPDNGRVYNDVSEWERHDDHRIKLTSLADEERYSHDNPSKRSYSSKPSASFRLNQTKESGFDDMLYQGNNKNDVQPGFQRILYDVRVDNKVKNSPTMIEVSPGEYLRLRGADETWKAIHMDFYVPCTCICCELTLFCIQDAVFVLCPECLAVSPLEGVVVDGYDGGVGIGFTMESLANWQEEIKMQENPSNDRVV
jgi:hypothetical protein